MNQKFLLLVLAVTCAVGTVQSFPAVEDEPTTATPEPTTATPEPTTATPEPTTATPEPTDATPEPTTATPEPTDATPEPTTATPEPTDATPEPTDATPEPTTATPEPTDATPEPTTATPEPTDATPEPTTATPEPTDATPEPTTATPEPTDATPEPTTATPEATTPTAEPTTPTAEPTTPTAKPTTPTAEPTTPTAEPTTPTAEPTTPTAEPTTPTTEGTKPSSDGTKPTTQSPSSTTPAPDVPASTVNDESGKPCILASMALTLDVKYTTEDNSTGNYTVIVPVDKDHVTGACTDATIDFGGQKLKGPIMISSWSWPTENTREVASENSVLIQFTDDGKSTTLEKISATISLNNEERFPGAQNPDKPLALTAKIGYSTDKNTRYTCTEAKSFESTGDAGKINLDDVQIEVGSGAENGEFSEVGNKCNSGTITVAISLLSALLLSTIITIF